MICKKILVPVDLSARSMGAARYGVSLAGVFDAELLFLHVLRKGWPLDEPERQVRRRIMNMPGAGRFLVREGEPVPAILEAAETEGAGLILMPTRGVSGLKRLFGRSVTARVMRGARCPVWAGRNHLSLLSDRPIRQVLCGLSLGPRACEVLRTAAKLAARFRAKLSVVHASAALDSLPAYPRDPELAFWLRKMAKEEIRAVEEQAGANAEIWLEPDSPGAALPALADRLGADLLVIGKSPQKRLLGDLRTMSYALVCSAPCPVASV